MADDVEGGGGDGGVDGPAEGRVEELEREVARLRGLLAERHADKRRTAWEETMRKARALASQRQLLTGDWKAIELPRVSKTGFLSKRKSRPQAHLLQYRRFFVLVGNQLYYYKKPEDAEPRGSVMLAGCSVRIVSPTERCMEVDSPASNKAYFLFADTETELDEWAAAISEASIMSLRVDMPGAHPHGPDSSGDELTTMAERRARADGFLAALLGELRSDAPVPADHVQLARQVLSDPLGVRAFTELMNRERSRPDLSVPENFGRLCELVNAALLTAFETDDFARARALLNMSNTFFLAPGGAQQQQQQQQQQQRRVYVMRHVANHKIWVSLRVWEGIFYEAITAETRRHVLGGLSAEQAAEAEDHDVADAMDIEMEMDRLPAEEKKNIVFGQLLSFANEMINFNLSYSTCSHFVMALSIGNELSEEQRRTLFEHLNSIYSTKYGRKR